MQTTHEQAANAAMYEGEQNRQRMARQHVEETTKMIGERTAKYYADKAEQVPTPTQLENDLAALGVPIPDAPHERAHAPAHHERARS